MTLKIVSWNINSVRLRIGLVEEFLNEYQPDILCLQEIKCQNDQFPSKNFKKLGYEHIAVHGQKGYHGVATVSKRPLSNVHSIDYCDKGDTRHIATTFEAGGKPIQLHNYYVPAGGDEADPDKNPKYKHKLEFLGQMLEINASSNDMANVLVGDLNIAPHENDVWSHKQLLKVVSHTPQETEFLDKIRDEGDWCDLVREKIPPEETLFSWWSYRSKDWENANKGRRLDHIWGSKELVKDLTSVLIAKELRGVEKPSDHAPVIAQFNLD